MAYRKAAKRSKTKKRRGRVGAVRAQRGVNFQKVIGLIGGAALTAFAYQAITKNVTKDWVGKAVAGGAVVVGAFLPMFIKNDLARAAGDGMVAAGGYKLLQEFDVLNGIPFVAGWKDMNLINGPGPGADSTPKPTAQQVNRVTADLPFRPSMSQIMNGVYRRPYR